ncbi:MAG: ATP-binding protein [Chitinivorax sp.]
MKLRVPMPRSLRSRLLLACSLVEIVLLSLLLSNSVRLINEALEASVESALQQTVPMLNAIIAPNLVEGDYATLQDSLNEVVNAHAKGVVYVLVLDGQQRIAARAGINDARQLPPPVTHIGSWLDQPVLHLQQPVTFAGQTLGTLRFGLSTEIIASARSALLQQGGLIATVEVALTFLLLSLLGFWLTKNLAHLISGSQAIAAGHYDQPVPVSGNDEIAELAHNFNRMAGSVQQKMQELRASESEYRALFEQAAVGMGHIGVQDHCWLRVNPKLAEILDCEPQQLLGKSFTAMFQPADMPTVERNRTRLDSGERQVFENDVQLRRTDGTLVWSRLTASLHRNEAGEPQYYIAVVQDDSKRKAAEAELEHYRMHLEDLVAQRTTALAAANRELESFSYSVSHDLKAPLRSIDGFSQILAEDYESLLDNSGRDYLQRIRRAVQHMGRLTDALLSLAKVGRGECRLETLDFSDLVQGVVDDLKIAQPRRKVNVVIQPGMQIVADANLLRTAMQNLLDNAWKYTGKAADARVEIGSFNVQGNTVFFVRDNGAGFNPAYSSRLFGVFQRLHTAEEFQGTGVGLATVQRVIHRHGGRIWAEAEPGQGAVFYFTIQPEVRAAAA